jgi:uncharacterized OsmC-like protein
MTINATIQNSFNQNNITVETDGNTKLISIPSKATGFGSAVNGGELLFLSLATCFCNDLYREAPRRGINIHSVKVTVNGEFGKEGEPAIRINYNADVESDSSKAKVDELIAYVDSIAEIHNTLRKGIAVIQE